MTEYTISQLLTYTLFGGLEVFASIVIAFTLLRICFSSYLTGIIVLSLFLASISTVLLDIYSVPFELNEIIVVLVTVLTYMLWLRLPWGYSILLTLLGYIMKEIVLLGISFLSVWAGIVPSLASIMNYPPSTITVQFITFIFTVPLTIFLYYRGIGFMFLDEKWEHKNEFKRINVLITSSIALSLIALQTLYHYFAVKSVVAYPVIAMVICLFVLVLWGCYFRSQGELKKQAAKFKDLLN